jgi:hypothetical protein
MKEFNLWNLDHRAIIIQTWIEDEKEGIQSIYEKLENQ